MAKTVYKRALLKLSGESLKEKSKDLTYSPESISAIVSEIKKAAATGVQLGIVIGAGNLWRGVNGRGWKLNRVTADQMGMLATVMNSICLRDSLIEEGIPAVVQCPISVNTVTEPLDRISAVNHMSSGKIVIFGGGTGSPFFTTDTAAALRALETGCDVLMKATKVDGVYSADPVKNPSAVRYKELSFKEAISKKLAVMDMTAFSLCEENKLPVVVFNFSKPGNLTKVLRGDTACASVVR
jgi:uridylate kinase